ncbi:MAG: protein translocase subunit SecD [Spirochaetaceae bacterium]|nr:MAG: protein translocase subunit SecD [Spirochaetaceae bacterium]
MSKRIRFVVVLLLVGLSAIFISPTIRWYFFVSDDDKALAAGSRAQVRDYAQAMAREDLSELESLAATDQPLPDRFDYVVRMARDNRRRAGEDVPSEWTTTELLRSFRGRSELYNALEAHYRDYVLGLKDLKSRIIELGLDLSGGINVVIEADPASLAERLNREPTDEEITDAVDLAIEVLTSRIDRFGVTEPQIRRMDETRISIDIPGDDDRERVNSFLMGRGSLRLHIVDEEATSTLDDYQRRNPGWNPELDGVPDFVPTGSIVREYVTRDEYGIDRFVRYIALKGDVNQHGLDGIHIQEAQVGRDPVTNQPQVNFVLDREGGDIFARLTRDNVGRSLAVVMDDRVRSWATIQEEIPTGNVRISGLSIEEASNLAIVLRTASLPIELSVVNQTVVGAQLGEAAIEAGLNAISFGFVLVMIFMFVYYKSAGINANLALVLNLFFIVSILSVFNLTLTLTSIAGIILTVGMAVDANVIIFERIKEEYRLGKSAQAAIKAGFEKAFWTVMDANITTFIAALFLSQIGSGPIQGFAITLAVGIVCSMFTALFVSRLVFDFGTDTLRRARLSIGWGIR